MFMNLLLLPIMGPINGIMWIGEKIQERTDSEFNDQENLHKQLLNLQLSFDLGEVSEEEFESQEEELLLKIQALEEQYKLEQEFEDFEYQSHVLVGKEDFEDKSQTEKENLVLSP